MPFRDRRRGDIIQAWGDFKVRPDYNLTVDDVKASPLDHVGESVLGVANRTTWSAELSSRTEA